MKKEINLGQFKKLNFYYVKITSFNKHQLLSVHYKYIFRKNINFQANVI